MEFLLEDKIKNTQDNSGEWRIIQVGACEQVVQL